MSTVAHRLARSGVLDSVLDRCMLRIRGLHLGRLASKRVFDGIENHRSIRDDRRIISLAQVAYSNRAIRLASLGSICVAAFGKTVANRVGQLLLNRGQGGAAAPREDHLGRAKPAT
jgi:hypothetical protein